MGTVEESGSRGRHALKGRIETFLKNFEWTWTSAVVFSLAVVFFLLISTTVMPSFWLYFADQRLKWDGGSPQVVIFWTIPGVWLQVLRDAVTMGLASMPLIVALIATAAMQNWRRKLRGETGGRPTGGYR
jgi:hypothetical protein